MGVRWVDRNKGSVEEPDIRSRLVAQEFASKDKEGLFAATPPLGAARALLSIAASQGRRRPGHYQVMLLDVKRLSYMASCSGASILNFHLRILVERMVAWWVSFIKPCMA